MGQVISRAVILFLSGVSVSFAQSNYAVVTGAVKDPQRLPVSAATVSFKAVATEEVRRFVTNEQGLFEAAAPLAGRLRSPYGSARVRASYADGAPRSWSEVFYGNEP